MDGDGERRLVWYTRGGDGEWVASGDGEWVTSGVDESWVNFCSSSLSVRASDRVLPDGGNFKKKMGRRSVSDFAPSLVPDTLREMVEGAGGV